MGKYTVHRLDANAQAIRLALEAVGATVSPIAPVDFLVGLMNRNWLLEIKTATGKVRTKKQRDFLASWKGQCAVVRTPEDALRVIGMLIEPDPNSPYPGDMVW